MKRRLASAALLLFLAVPGEAAGYSQAELKRMFQRSVETDDPKERDSLRAAIAKAAPNSAYGLASHASLLDGRVTAQETIAMYTKALELDPSIAMAHYNRANKYLNLKQYKKAEEGYAKAITLGFENGVAYSGLASSQYGQGRDAEAARNFDKSIKLDPAQPFVYNNRGAIYLKRGEYDKAISDFNSALSLSKFGMAYMNRADAWAGKKEFRKALADYATAESMIGGAPELLTRRGKVYLDLKDYPKARKDFAAAVAEEPGKTLALQGLGNACFYQNDFDCAEDAYKRAIESDPGKINIYDSLCNVYLRKEMREKAAETLEKALERAPEREDLRDKLVRLQRASGDAAGTEKSLTPAINSGKAGALDYFKRGEARLEKNDYRGAEADLKEALKLRPEEEMPAVYLALALLGSGRRSEALEIFSSVVESNPARLVKLRKGAARTDAGPGGNVRGILRRMLAVYDGAEEESPVRTASRHGNSGRRTAQEDCFCIHYTGGTPPYFLAKAPNAPADCKSVKFKADPAKPGLGGLKNCREFLQNQ